MHSITSNTRTVSHTIIEQGRLWFRFARILDTELRAQGSRLWVKPKLHAQYGLRQGKALRARSFILPSRLEGGDGEVLEAIAQGSPQPCRELDTRRTKNGSLVLYSEDGQRLGHLNRPAWSWIRPLVEIGYTPKFYLQRVAVHEGALKAKIVIAHFHEGVEMYLMEHYRQRVEAALA